MISCLGVLDSSHLDEVTSMYGLEEVEKLAAHFRLNEDNLIMEWTSLLDVLAERPRCGSSIDAIYQLLRGDDMAHLGLGQQYPLLAHLYAIALTIPVSTAEVERVFSQLALIKSDHRNRLRGDTAETAQRQAEPAARKS